MHLGGSGEMSVVSVQQFDDDDVVFSQQDVVDLQQDVAEIQQGVVIQTHCKGCGVVLSQQERELMLDFCDICQEYGSESLEGKLVWPEAMPNRSETYD
jgi:hypothetical protein